MVCTDQANTQPDPREAIYLVTGAKGGVGKSMLALVVIDQLRLSGRKVLYFESDTTNADVWLCMQRDPDDPGAGTIEGLKSAAASIANSCVK